MRMEDELLPTAEHIKTNKSTARKTIIYCRYVLSKRHSEFFLVLTLPTIPTFLFWVSLHDDALMKKITLYFSTGV